MKADCYRFAVHPRISSWFALHYLNSLVAQEFAAAHHHGMTLTRIGLGNFRRIPFSLPPVAEQRRIVAKVDELMALCDRLEASLTGAQDHSRHLLDALLAEALTPAEAAMQAEAPPYDARLRLLGPDCLRQMRLLGRRRDQEAALRLLPLHRLRR
ncbi:MAG: hypothetical protein M3461_04100 [Pseudomonadota bacterium]|nr:hypothetical protein [Pseudomonadota bacterium]